MSTLIVLMPPRDPAVHSQEWQLPELPFVLLDKTGNTQRAGRSALGLLPKASATILMIAARDLLTLAATVPPLKGPRLRQALPNVVEDHLIQDAQTCHLALDPKRLADGRQVVAAIDRGWFRFLLEGFTAAGHRNLRAVPVARCLPAAQAVEAVQEVQVTEPAGAAEPGAAPNAAAPETPAPEPVTACVLGHVVATAPTLLPGVALEPAAATAQAALELAIVRG
ncbi:MAG TPA: type II secretion system protein GspL, partial [Paraburkholderia sp.]|uniref:type II secretion system protein GspL n=1 Tax=Paraburkholderia sp. TaxID=1926495 RepID=UPI002B486532